jgi:hypothetical protein
MGEQKRKEQAKTDFIFGKKNYKWFFIGLGCIAVGFFIMAYGYDFTYAGKNNDANTFNPAIFRWDRIRLAPTLVLIGFGMQVYAILAKPDKEDNSN